MNLAIYFKFVALVLAMMAFVAIVLFSMVQFVFTLHFFWIITIIIFAYLAIGAMNEIKNVDLT